MNKAIYVENELVLKKVAAQLAKSLMAHDVQTMIIFLKGDLGAGKTTFAKGFLQAIGFEGLVKSPTYTLVESYEVSNKVIYHMDWYRLQDEMALDEMGILAHLQEEAIILIEWPLDQSIQIPQPDWCIEIITEPFGRNVLIHAMSEKGYATLPQMDF